jgi:phosphohistidine phosphatase SixA
MAPVEMDMSEQDLLRGLSEQTEDDIQDVILRGGQFHTIDPRRALEASVARVTSHTGAPLGTLLSLRDRTEQEELAEARGSKKPVECAELAADEQFSQAFELLRSRKDKAVILVGHEPYLSGFLGIALAGRRARLRIDFKKGDAACIEFTARVEPGRACLHWFMPPRVLRALR